MDKKLTDLIKDLEFELLQPCVRKSKDQLNRLLADDFIEFGASGNIYNKQNILDSLPDSKEVKFIIYDFTAFTISDDTVLVTYRIEKEILESGEKSFSLRSSLWQKRSGQWQMFFHQGTPQI